MARFDCWVDRIWLVRRCFVGFRWDGGRVLPAVLGLGVGGGARHGPHYGHGTLGLVRFTNPTASTGSTQFPDRTWWSLFIGSGTLDLCRVSSDARRSPVSFVVRPFLDFASSRLACFVHSQIDSAERLDLSASSAGVRATRTSSSIRPSNSFGYGECQSDIVDPISR